MIDTAFFKVVLAGYGGHICNSSALEARRRWIFVSRGQPGLYSEVPDSQATWTDLVSQLEEQGG